MAKVCGVDIGSAFVHVVELEGSPRRFKLTNVAAVPLARGTDSEDEDFVAIAGARLSEAGIGSERSLLAVSAADCVLRSMFLPFKGKDEIRKVLKFEAESYIHSHSIDDVVVDASIVEEGEEGTTLFMSACPKDVLEPQLAALRGAGIDPERADLDAHLLARAGEYVGVFESSGGENAKQDLLLGIGARSTLLGLVCGGEVVTTRVLRWGLDLVVQGLAEKLAVTPAELDKALASALGLPVAIGIPGDAGEEEPEEESPIELSQDDLLALASDLAKRIEREVTRFLSGVDFTPSRILLTGGGADIPNMVGMCSERFALPVERLALLERAKLAGAQSGCCQDVAFAAALASLEVIRSTLDFRQEELSYKPRFDRLKFPLAVAICAACLALVGVMSNLLRELASIESAIGTIKQTTATRRQPQYSGLLRRIAHPSRGGLLKDKLPLEKANQILEAIKPMGVYDRLPYIRTQLEAYLRQLRRETGSYPELKLESGLAVLQAFAAAIDAANTKPAVKRFVVPLLSLSVASRSAQRYFDFTVAFFGDDFREQQAAFLATMRGACGPPDRSPFASVEQKGSRTVYDNGLELGYRFSLHAMKDSKVFQPL